MQLRSAAVVGLGLIGGSLARELAARGVRVLGHDRDPHTLRAACVDGIVEPLGADFEGIRGAELVVLAVPVRATPAVLREMAPRLARARLVIDVGSTQCGGVAAAEAAGIGGVFVGTHPLAGNHVSGWGAARTGLFRGARVFFCPTRATRPAAAALARELWESLGALPETIDADEHDRRLAWTSHLPQAAATALALALQQHGVVRAELGPGGRDTTRLAASSAEMWSDVVLANADALLPALAGLGAAVTALEAAIRAGDRTAVHEIFAAGTRWAAEVGAG
jgi:prephenate dehydrogenase